MMVRKVISKRHPYKVRSIIICEDAREEKNGKEILIGVYSHSIDTAELPFLVKGLCVRLHIDFASDFEGQVIFQIRDPLDVYMSNFSAPWSGKHRRAGHVFTFNALSTLLMHAGEYSIWFGADSDPEKIGTFEVNLVSAEDPRFKTAPNVLEPTS